MAVAHQGKARAMPNLARLSAKCKVVTAPSSVKHEAIVVKPSSATTLLSPACLYKDSMCGHDEQKDKDRKGCYTSALVVYMIADLTQPSSECSCIGACHSACFLLPRQFCSMAALGQWPPQVDCPLLGAHQEGAVHALQRSLSLHAISNIL